MTKSKEEPAWLDDTKKSIVFTYEEHNHNLTENDVILFNFYDQQYNLCPKIEKGKIIGFGWGFNSAPYYIIVHRWRESEQKWGSSRWKIKIPGYDTGRAVNGELNIQNA